MANLCETGIDDFLAGFLKQILRSADDQLKILRTFGGVCCSLRIAARTPAESGLVEDPLRGRVEERHEGPVQHRAIETEMDAGEGRGLDMVEMSKGWIRLLQAL